MGYRTTVSGNVSATGSGTIATAQSGSVGGSVIGGTGTITIGESSTVSGNVQGSGDIMVNQTARISGNVSSGSGTVTVAYQSEVLGTLSTTGPINLNQEAHIAGTITGGSGAVSVGYAAILDSTLTTSSGAIDLAQNVKAWACVKSTGSASITLGYTSSINSVCCGTSCSTSCVVNNSTYAMPPRCAGSTPTVSAFSISGTGSASTCTPQTLTITAVDSSGNTVTGYTGTLSLSTSTGRGDWSAGSSPAPSGTFVAGASNSGAATYTFKAGDNGVVKLRLSHSLAQNVTVTAVDSSISGSSTTSAAISFKDNAFVWAEDLNNKITGSNVVVAGRAHDMQVSLIKKDPTTGSCGVATNFNGSRNLKLWRTDNGGPWAAPSIVSPALSVPATRPGANNLALTFSAGVATLNLATTDIGKYTLNLDDDSLTYASATVSGSIGDLIVRPFTITVSGLTLSGTSNPGGSLASDGVFGKAGAAFSATVSAYRWSSTADVTSDGAPDSTAAFAQVTAGGLAPGFSSSVTLSPLAGSQTPTSAVGGVLGSLSNGTVSSFAGGTATVSNLAYSEVGSFQFVTSGVVASFLSSGVALDAVVFNAAGNPVNRVGRFVPAGYTVSGASTTHRSAMACATASSFTYLDEDFTLGFTLTAQNTLGAATKNYVDTFAKLVLTTPGNFNLAGIAGSTMFKAGGRLSTSASTGSWGAGSTGGTAAVTLTARAARAASADGPHDSAQFGIAPADSDGVTMLTLNLDTDTPANGADSTLLGQVPLRHGRLRLQNGMSAANRSLALPVAAQYWNGSAFITNPSDACTRVTAANLSFGNFRKTLTAADAVMAPASVTVNPSGSTFITLRAPSSSHVGSMDLAIALGSGSNPSDQSCLKTAAGWTAATAASAGANLAALRGAWCGSAATSDPSARATWGVYRGSNGVIYQRENY